MTTLNGANLIHVLLNTLQLCLPWVKGMYLVVLKGDGYDLEGHIGAQAFDGPSLKLVRKAVDSSESEI